MVKDSTGQAIAGVTISIEGTELGAVTGPDGLFQFRIAPEFHGKNLVFRHVRYQERIINLDEFDLQTTVHTIILSEVVHVLDQVSVSDYRITDIDSKVSTISINPLNSQFAPAPFQDISNLLATLPGVTVRNEFSSAYSVRGGNYDENLVYVNDIPIYRPQIITAGQQEGLGFVNTDLTKSIDFSSGGWEPAYGDGLASTLNVEYKRPEKFAGSAQIGLLGGSMHLEGITAGDKLTYAVGVRQKSSEYLLNTLETKGEYRPKFFDVQTYLNYDLSDKHEKGRTTLGLIFSYAQNNYLVEPTNRETTFGTFNEQLRLYVAFEGRERLTYDTWQTGLTLSHRISENWRSRLILSGILSKEREYYDIESGYLLCNVDNNPASAGFNKCLTNIGIGTNFYSGRNLLDAEMLNLEWRNEIAINAANTLEFGIGYGDNSFNDRLREYEFIDSADYVTITESVISEATLDYARLTAYAQQTTEINSRQKLTFGLRSSMQSTDNKWLISPRLQYSWNPGSMPKSFIRAAAGIYRQMPLYREFRNRSGELQNVSAQSSAHFIAGIDVNFEKWERPFIFSTEVYYKYFWNVNPYDIENVRMRYFAENIATAYAAGVDMRISGEFIPGDESWFSLGFLTTREDLETDTKGYIPRPTDQRINAAIFFQDHIPNAPTFRVHVRMLYATGLPFSPPGNDALRNAFRGSEYQRLDIGFSKIIYFDTEATDPFLKSLWISFEILNLTAHENTISYYWVEDVNGHNYAVPNSLSQRFFNVRMALKF
ncbi:MAG: TonB-dependent receptor plug domain-containing protein [Cyclobacteriaceae bacterium]|nr:TonB-dependent receptor plug domain-containing protein [Cyclobacteriaceae bacterium]